ncbi:MAG: hypothetical protein C0602_09500, partial [Denitrovibrio sp.]
MAQSVGVVKSLNGLVIARTPEGDERTLAIGNRVDMNEIIITTPGSNIVIALDNGNEIHLDSMQQLALDDSVVNQFDESDAEAEARAMQEALERGDAANEAETATGDDEDGIDLTLNFIPGDTSEGNVGSYLLGTESGQNQIFTQTNFGGESADTNVRGVGIYSLADPSSAPEGFTLNPDGSYVFDGTTDAYDYLSEGDKEEFFVDLNITYENGEVETETLDLVVTGTNDLPVAEIVSLEAVEDGSVISGQLAGSDVDQNDTISYSLADPENSPEGITINADGTYEFDPSTAYNYLPEGESEVIEVEYIVTDDKGGTNTSTLTITVTGTNDGPVAEAETASATAGDISLSGQLDASDIDGEIVSYEVADAPEGLTVNNDGTYTYAPAAGTFDYLPEGETEIIEVSYEVTDDSGAKTSNTLTITVTGTNDGPVAAEDSGVTAEDTSLTINVLANDTDVDGDVLTVESFEQPNNGTAVLNDDGTFTYTPNADYNGSDSFTYTITDGKGGTSETTVSLTVDPSNDMPIAVDNTVTVDEDGSAVINVLANDTDIDGDTLTVESFEQPTNGTAVLNDDGTFTYTPNADYNGSDSFEYTITDGKGGTSTATVNIGITSVNDGPVAAEDSGVTAEDTSLTINVLANDTDIDGDTLTVESF